jgi:hypothetical protein
MAAKDIIEGIISIAEFLNRKCYQNDCNSN